MGTQAQLKDQELKVMKTQKQLKDQERQVMETQKYSIFSSSKLRAKGRMKSVQKTIKNR